MKHFSKICIYAGITILSLTCFIGCKNNNESEFKNEVTITPNNTQNSSETELAPVATEDNTIVTDDIEASDQDTTTDTHIDNSSDNDDTTTSNNTTTNSTNNNDTTFTDHLNTAEYKVNVDGTYTFQCDPSDKKAYWDIYVLDEPFEDAFRYLSSAYQPSLKATNESQTIKLKKGQYVYCVCSENSFTDEGTSGNFKCPLTISLNN